MNLQAAKCFKGRFAGRGAAGLVPVLLCVLFLFCISCGRKIAYSSRYAHLEDMQEVVFGFAWPFSVYEDLYKKGIELAVEEINAGGGILGRPLKTILVDDQGTVNGGLIAAQALAENPDVAAVIGHADSFITLPCSLIYQYNGLLMVTPSATAPAITDQGFDLVFRTIKSDSEIGAGMADYCLAQGYSNVVIYYVKNAYGKGLANAFEREADLIGLGVADRLSYDFPTPRIFKQVVSSWKEYNFDAIFLAATMPEIGEFVRLVREEGLDVPIVSGDGLDSASLLELGPSVARDITVVSAFHHSAPREEVRAFVDLFQERYGELPDAWAAQAYDTVRLLAFCMEKAGTVVPEKVAEVLRDADWVGVTGQHRFNGQGDVIGKPLVLKKVEQGAFSFLREFETDELAGE